MANSGSIHDFVPKFKQPFSIQVASGLDIQTLMNELSRLDDSVRRLSETQDTLKEFLDEATRKGEQRDPELEAAFEENKDVIGSQEERIHMITLVLVEKGVSAESLAHYLPKSQDPRGQSLNTMEPINDDGGIDL
ncbi:hypothetical protein FRC18_008203 [Serendipita sp. 400]|nr:hypothetical protein FRC18_008203 [Serendipita sp. 400]